MCNSSNLHDSRLPTKLSSIGEKNQSSKNLVVSSRMASVFLRKFSVTAAGNTNQSLVTAPA